MGKRSALAESGFGLGGLRCFLMTVFCVIFAKRGEINLKKNTPWILLMCLLEDMKIWNNADNQSRMSKDSVQLLFSSSAPPFVATHTGNPYSAFGALPMGFLLLLFQ